MSDIRFASVVLYVPGNAKRVLDFYVQAFGIKLRHYDKDFDFGELETGTTSIAIANHSAGQFMVGKAYKSAADGYPKNTEIALYVQDVPAAFDRAIKAGCIALCEPKVMPWRQTVAYVQSIEGTMVGLLTPFTPQTTQPT